MFDELEPLFRRWWELRYKNRFHRYWTVEELMEMKDIQQFWGWRAVNSIILYYLFISLDYVRNRPNGDFYCSI